MFFSERQSWANVTWLIAAGDFTARSQWMSTRHGCLAGGSDQHGQFPASNVPHGRRVWRRTDPKNLRHTRSQRLRDQNEVQSNPGSFPARRHGQSPETFSFEFSIQLICFFDLSDGSPMCRQHQPRHSRERLRNGRPGFCPHSKGNVDLRKLRPHPRW